MPGYDGTGPFNGTGPGTGRFGDGPCGAGKNRNSQSPNSWPRGFFGIKARRGLGPINGARRGFRRAFNSWQRNPNK